MLNLEIKSNFEQSIIISFRMYGLFIHGFTPMTQDGKQNPT